MGITNTYTCDICESVIDFPKERMGMIDIKIEIDNNEEPRNDRKDAIHLLTCAPCGEGLYQSINDLVEATKGSQ